MNTIYRKSFIFEAERFEEFQNGELVNCGNCRTQIVGRVMNSNCIGFLFQGDMPQGIKNHFGLPIFGEEYGDVLADRVQYGRIPDSLSWNDSTDPVVCNIFNNMTCIRFAMMSPLRIVEFYGKFVDIRTL